MRLEPWLLFAVGLVACRALVGFEPYEKVPDGDASTPSDGGGTLVDGTAGGGDATGDASGDASPSWEARRDPGPQDIEPRGCPTLEFKLWGAGGYVSNVGVQAGAGGYATVTVPANPLLRIEVGAAGKLTSPAGASRVLTGATVYAVAGGGGGAPECSGGSAGGAGGGELGESPFPDGGGGPEAPGAGCDTGNASGSSGDGGVGGKGGADTDAQGGHGGNGWRGGGGGCADPFNGCTGGGGGSGYVLEGAGNVSGYTDAGVGPTPGNAGDPDRKDAGNPGAHGAVLWRCTRPR